MWAASSVFPEEFQRAVDTTELDWDDTIEVAIGFDYRLGRSLLLDLGYRSAPDPAPDETYYFPRPQTTKNVIGMGVTYLQDFWRASFALEYQAGDERKILLYEDEDAAFPFYRRIDEKNVEDILIPSLSFTYAF